MHVAGQGLTAMAQLIQIQDQLHAFQEPAKER
jgi:hypothetical protein